MTFPRHFRKRVVVLVIAVTVFAASACFAWWKLKGNSPASSRSSRTEIGLYLDNGNLWRWVNGRQTQLTRLGNLAGFDWHPAGGEVVYVTHETDGSYKAIDRKLDSEQELVISQGSAEMGPKLLCTPNGVLIVDAAATTTPGLLLLTITSVSYDGTTSSSFWTQVPLTAEQFDRTTRLVLSGSTPLIVSPGGLWSIGSSTLGFDTSHVFLGPSGVTFADGTFMGLMQDAQGTFLGLRAVDGMITSVAPPPTSSGVLQPFVRGASRTTDGTILVYELGIYGSGTGTDGTTSLLSYETWQYTKGARKPRLIAKGDNPSFFTFQFTGGSAPVQSGTQPAPLVTTDTGLMFRDQPVTIGSTVLEVAAPTEKRSALALGQGWVQAAGLGRAKGKTGWLYGAYVRITAGSKTYVPFARVSVSSPVKVYLDESLNGPAATALEKGDSVVALGMTPDKRAVRILLPSGTNAYIAASSVVVSH